MYRIKDVMQRLNFVFEKYGNIPVYLCPEGKIKEIKPIIGASVMEESKLLFLYEKENSSINKTIKGQI
jgi:hypothetical protein